jgi:phosphoribosylamine--glycine ligase
MKVLIVGSGGREHALAWKASQSSKVTQIFVAPGNGGTQQERLVTNVPIPSNNIDELAKFALENTIDITIVGPEDPLVLGITDKFQSLGLNCFGPSKGAAQLEGSKEFMKDFLIRHHIPTATYKSFTKAKEAIAHIKLIGCPVVIKADGLAAGKGVTVALEENEAIQAVEECLNNNIFGTAGEKLIVEEFLEGEEASFIVMTDGDVIVPFASSQDHKARDDNDLGPNTGGMGAYSPAPVVTNEIHNKIMNEVIIPTVQGMKKDGLNYCGFLYAGVMIDSKNNLKVLEFNCRFGDPETQPIMMRLDSDIAELCLEATSGTLEEQSLQWKKEIALGVVMASGGYPSNYETGKEIFNLPIETKRIKVFHAGTSFKEGKTFTSGGRVLCVTALGVNTTEAQKEAYQAASSIKWDNCFYRSDIGHRAIKREK